MTTTITDYPDVRKRLQELGCASPSGFALLPINFDTAGSIAEFRQAAETPTIRKLLRSIHSALSNAA